MSTKTKTKTTRRALSPAEREAADAARAARISELHDRIGEQVEQLTEDPAWRAMLDAAKRFHAYSVNNILSIMMQAAERGMVPTRVAGFTTWKTLGRTVVKGSKGLAVLAPCTYKPKVDSDRPADGEQPTTAGAGTAGEGQPSPVRRVLRGFRVAYVFDVSQTEGEPLPDVAPVLLSGDAPAALWDGLAAQVAAHGYTLTRQDCGANGVTDRATMTVKVRPDVDDAQAVKTLAHELAHIKCGHTAQSYDYAGCRGRAEAEAESVAYIVTGWAGLDAGSYTVPYVAGWSRGDVAVIRAAAATVTAAAHRIIAALDGTDDPADAATEASDAAAEGTGQPIADTARVAVAA